MLQELFDQYDRLDVDRLVEKLGSKKAGEVSRPEVPKAIISCRYPHSRCTSSRRHAGICQTKVFIEAQQTFLANGNGADPETRAQPMSVAEPTWLNQCTEVCFCCG